MTAPGHMLTTHIIVPGLEAAYIAACWRRYLPTSGILCYSWKHIKSAWFSWGL